MTCIGKFIKKTSVIFVSLALAVSSCEKLTIADFGDYSTPDKNGNLIITTVIGNDATPTRASISLSSVSSRLNIALFSPDGTKVKSIAQSSQDNGFGTVSVSVPPGIYSIVAVAHSCNGNATITSEEKVTFPGNKVTDTFCYHGTICVTDTNNAKETAILRRIVSMLRLTIDDNESVADATQIKFYYTGGSSTLSPSEGLGVVQSKQTEYRAWNDSGVYDLYTMPHSEDDVIDKLTVTALDAGDNPINELVLRNIPVAKNRVTMCNSSFGNGTAFVSVSISVNPEWADTIRYIP